MKELRIVVVDDSDIIRDYLKRAFAQVEGCTIVGMANDGFEAINMIEELQPHVVVLDITMPHRDGIDVLRDIRRHDSKTIIIMFTSDPSVILKEVCFEAGANYYLDKSQFGELIDTCRLEQQNLK